MFFFVCKVLFLGFICLLTSCNLKSSFSDVNASSFSTILQRMVVGGPAVGDFGLTCGITLSDEVLCWGQNSVGQTGAGLATDPQLNPIYVVGGEQGGARLSNIVDLAAGHSSTCAVDNTGAVYCWGTGTNGALGNATTGVNSNTPVRVVTGDQADSSGFLSNIVEVKVGFQFACARSSSQNVYCWGTGNNGRLGYGSTASSNIPRQVLGGAQGGAFLGSIRQISLGRANVCAVTTADELYCWGDGRALGQASGTPSSSSPVRVLGGEQGGAFLNQIRSVHVGWNNACALIQDGSVYCWGDESAELGVGGSSIDAFAPTRVLGGDQGGTYLQNITNITYGFARGCASDISGDFFCWGWNYSGHLLQPTRIAGGDQGGTYFRDVDHMIFGPTFGCFIDATNRAYCHGSNNSGQKGNSITSSFSWVMFALDF